MHAEILGIAVGCARVLDVQGHCSAPPTVPSSAFVVTASRQQLDDKQVYPRWFREGEEYPRYEGFRRESSIRSRQLTEGRYENSTPSDVMGCATTTACSVACVATAAATARVKIDMMSPRPCYETAAPGSMLYDGGRSKAFSGAWSTCRSALVLVFRVQTLKMRHDK